MRGHWRPLRLERDGWRTRLPMLLAGGEAPPALGDVLLVGEHPLGGPLAIRVEGVMDRTVWFVALPEGDVPMGAQAWRVTQPPTTGYAGELARAR